MTTPKQNTGLPAPKWLRHDSPICIIAGCEVAPVAHGMCEDHEFDSALVGGYWQMGPRGVKVWAPNPQTLHDRGTE